MDLVTLLRQPEGKTLEYKRELSSPDGALRTIVAFANTAGGTLLVGVEDRTRAVRGVISPLDLEEHLANLVSDHVLPRLVVDLEILPWRRTHVLAVHVHPSSIRPHHLKREGPENGTYVRVGSTNRRADSALIAELGRYGRGEAYDEHPMPELDSEALDFRAASESFAAVRKLKRTDLESLRLVTRHQGRLVPTTGGMLLFGKDRERRFPDAWIQAGKFRGHDRSQIVDRSEFQQNLPEAIEAALGFVRKHSIHGAKIGAGRRREVWTLPPAAVREAVINAVAHADYSQTGAPIRVSLFDDRLEVENPGLLPFGLTVDDLLRGVSKLRNRVIGRVLHELGLVEQWGSGIQRMTKACLDAGLAAPVFEEIGTRFRVTLATTPAPSSQVALDETDRKIIAALTGDDGRTTSELAGEIGLTARSTRTRLARLVDRGLVREIGTGPQDPRRRYFKAE